MTIPGTIDLALSHNQEASGLADELVDTLEDNGFSAWADVKSYYSPLVSAEKQVVRAFTRARVICLFVGAGFRDTRWCQEEYALGLRSEQDLAIARVITIHEGESGRKLIPPALTDEPTFPNTREGRQGVIEFLSKLPDHSTILAEWTKRNRLGRSDLLGKLPIEERTKLIVDHVKFLSSRFSLGEFDLKNNQKYARRLELIGCTASDIPVHLRPALLMELAWRWTTEVLGPESIRQLLWTADSSSRESPIIDTVSPFLQLTDLFLQYLTQARQRRNPPLNTEVELLSVVDHVLCGFCALVVRAGVPIEEGFRDIDRLLSLWEGGDRRLSEVSNYLRSHLPTIAFSENA